MRAVRTGSIHSPVQRLSDRGELDPYTAGSPEGKDAAIDTAIRPVKVGWSPASYSEAGVKIEAEK